MDAVGTMRHTVTLLEFVGRRDAARAPGVARCYMRDTVVIVPKVAVPFWRTVLVPSVSSVAMPP